MGDRLLWGQNEPPGFAGSMAAAIEDALNEQLLADGMHPLPAGDIAARDRRRLFVAIAEGVIRHLDANPQALRVVFTHGPDHHDYRAHVDVRKQGDP
jgi:hypothetical protein